MSTNFQVALLVGVPTATIMLYSIVHTIFCRKWARVFREATERNHAELKAAIERHKLWEGIRINVHH